MDFRASRRREFRALASASQGHLHGRAQAQHPVDKLAYRRRVLGQALKVFDLIGERFRGGSGSRVHRIVAGSEQLLTHSRRFAHC